MFFNAYGDLRVQSFPRNNNMIGRRALKRCALNCFYYHFIVDAFSSSRSMYTRLIYVICRLGDPFGEKL